MNWPKHELIQPFVSSNTITTFLCDGCDAKIDGLRFCCLTCVDTDYCTSCVAKPSRCMYQGHTIIVSNSPLIPRNEIRKVWRGAPLNMGPCASCILFEKPILVHPTMMYIGMRPMQMEDVPELCDMEKESFPDYPFDAAYFARMIHDPICHACMVVTDNNVEVLAYAVVRNKGQQHWHLDSFCVKQEHRKKGIGHCLMNYIAIKAKMNIRAFTLHVNANNVAAQNLYKAYGFVVSKVVPGYYKKDPEQKDAYEMLLTILGTNA